jgi:putative addiction module killer protein
MINIIKYVSADGKCPFDDWFSKLKDPIGKAAVLSRFDRIKQGNLGDYKDIGDGVYELRLFTGPGYRIYYAWEGEQLVLLLTAGSKSQQSKDIQQAKTYWLEHRSTQNGNR